ncbi:MAG: hypothetical protein LBL16_04005 [Endomicrobium sp.]|nr:hypothetical protein [Endomicrobium sp.]
MKYKYINIMDVLIFCVGLTCLCSCCILKKDIIKVGEEGEAIESVGKEIEEEASKFKDKTLEEHTEKYLIEERKEDQNRVGYKARTISQRQKELSDDFEKEVNRDKGDFKNRWRKK